MPIPPPLPSLPPGGLTPPLSALEVTITGNVSGNVAFLNNGIPTVAPGPISGVTVDAGGPLGDATATTDQQGNFTIYNVFVNPGETISVIASAGSYETESQDLTLSTASASVSFVLPDDPTIVNQRLPLFGGTGNGAVDQAGNQYHYLGRGGYYATIGGQTEYFIPIGQEDYYCAALGIEYYPSADDGTYEFGSAYFACVENGQLAVLYGPVGGGVYMSLGSGPSEYFKPLP